MVLSPWTDGAGSAGGEWTELCDASGQLLAPQLGLACPLNGPRPGFGPSERSSRSRGGGGFELSLCCLSCFIHPSFFLTSVILSPGFTSFPRAAIVSFHRPFPWTGPGPGRPPC